MITYPVNESGKSYCGLPIAINSAGKSCDHLVKCVELKQTECKYSGNFIKCVELKQTECKHSGHFSGLKYSNHMNTRLVWYRNDSTIVKWWSENRTEKACLWSKMSCI